MAMTFYKFIQTEFGAEYQPAQGARWFCGRHEIFIEKLLYGGGYAATEGLTGLSLGEAAETVEALKEKVAGLVESMGGKLDTLIEQHIEKHGISPLYLNKEEEAEGPKTEGDSTMNKTYFDNCQTLQDLKTAYRRLAMEHHPDRGGDLEAMKRVNAEYGEAFERLQAGDTAEAKSSRWMDEKAAEYIEVVGKLIRMDGLEVELVGAWLWIGGDTRRHKDGIKAAGCFWAPKRQLWYWRPAGYKSMNSKRDMGYIRAKYGSVKIAADGKEERRNAPEAVPA